MAPKKKNAVNSFRPRKFEDFEIVDSAGTVVGHVRIKPSSILWSPKGEHSWYGLPIDDFGAHAKKHGKKQKK